MCLKRTADRGFGERVRSLRNNVALTYKLVTCYPTANKKDPPGFETWRVFMIMKTAGLSTRHGQGKVPIWICFSLERLRTCSRSSPAARSGGTVTMISVAVCLPISLKNTNPAPDGTGRPLPHPDHSKVPQNSVLPHQNNFHAPWQPARPMLPGAESCVSLKLTGGLDPARVKRDRPQPPCLRFQPLFASATNVEAFLTPGPPFPDKTTVRPK